MAKSKLPVSKLSTALTSIVPLNGVVSDGVDDPGREIRAGRITIFLFFGVFLGWCAFVRVDSAVYAHGMIAVAGQRQEVQHKTGGVVTKIDVKEGDQVHKDQILIELAGDQAEASANGLMAQYITLLAQQARLTAEAFGQQTFAEPPEFKNFTGENRQLADQAMRIQQQAMLARHRAVNAQVSVLQEQSQQANQAIMGAKSQIQSNEKRQALVQDELQSVKGLEQKGYAPKTRVRDLEQTLAGFEGDSAALRAEMGKSAALMGEAKMRQVVVLRQSGQDVVNELRDTQQKLSELLPQLGAAQSEYDRTAIRAPATGKVVGLTVNTVGGVIAPGAKVLDIVPDNAPLIVEANVDAKDGDDVKVGQDAQIRFSALQERDLPTMTGKVLEVSADSFIDQKSGQAFYHAQVQVSAENMRKIDQIRGAKDVLKPGLPAEIVVPLRKRTVLEYLVEPISQTIWRSFREH